MGGREKESVGEREINRGNRWGKERRKTGGGEAKRERKGGEENRESDPRNINVREP